MTPRLDYWITGFPYWHDDVIGGVWYDVLGYSMTSQFKNRDVRVSYEVRYHLFSEFYSFHRPFKDNNHSVVMICIFLVKVPKTCFGTISIVKLKLLCILSCFVGEQGTSFVVSQTLFCRFSVVNKGGVSSGSWREHEADLYVTLGVGEGQGGRSIVYWPEK